MKGTKNTTVIALTFFVLGLVACSPQSFEAQRNGSLTQDPGKQGGNPTPSPSTTPSADELSTLQNMKASEDQYGARVSIDTQDMSLVIRIPLGFNMFIEVSSTDMPKIKGGHVSTEVDSDMNSFLVVRLPLKALLRGVSELERADRLPNGDALPRMPAGEPATLGLTLSSKNKVKMNLYLAVEAAGIFIETPFDYGIPAYITVPIRNEAKTRILGYFTLVPQKASYQGGFFLAFALPGEVSEILNKYL